MRTITKDQIKQLHDLANRLNAEFERTENHPLRSIAIDCYHDDEDEPACAMYLNAWPTHSAQDESHEMRAIADVEHQIKALGIDCSIYHESSPDCHSAVWSVKN